ncbi:heterokaryon incompatibility protein-domain-containing protein [Tricladium varicosporioides]|nr:heterokaryon incompatibility protein-domain-containing protein [Hymenoscyphus varicosporioides]
MDPRFWDQIPIRELGKVFSSYNNVQFVDTGYPRKHDDRPFTSRTPARLRDIFSPSGQSQPLCKRCRDVDFHRLFGNRQSFVFAWSMVSIYKQSQACIFCQLLLDLLKIWQQGVHPKRDGYCVIIAYPSLAVQPQRAPDGAESEEVLMNRVWVRWQAAKLKKREPLYKLSRGDRDLDTIKHIGCADVAIQKLASQESNGGQEILHGRLVKNTIEPQLLRSWIDLCQSIHADQCCIPSLPSERFGMRVIDVTRRCIVEAQPSQRYVALSYVWGQTQQLLLTEETKPRLEDQDNALRDDDATIPQTIRDAVLACELLGERYLWIDALCIQQDNKASKDRQLEKMGLIYRCASFTIVAASGDSADAGLPGLRNSSRAFTQYSADLQGVKVCSTLPLFGNSVVDSKWHSRGWTCQEKHLSRRLLIFSASQVFFRCKIGFFSEDTIMEGRDSIVSMSRFEYSGRSDSDFQLSEHLPPIHRYGKLLIDYTSRQLGFENDALVALSGVLGTLSHAYTFFWGLPHQNLLETLHWHSPSGDMTQRRMAFPSWSWAGWAYPVQTAFFPGSEGEIRYPPIVPITEFYRVGRKGQALPVDTDQILKSVKFLEMPSGFYHARLFYELGPGRESREELDEPYCTHIHMDWPMDPPRLTRDELETMGALRSRLLRFYTWTFKIPVGREPDGVNGSMHNLWIGLLGARVWLDKEWRRDQPEKLDFMAIAQTTIPDWGRTAVHFYLILVEWRDGIMYRVQIADKPVEREELFDKFEPEWKVINWA